MPPSTGDVKTGAARRNWVVRGATAIGMTGVVFGLGVGFAMAGQPEPWQLGFQTPKSPVMEQVDSLHTFITITMLGVCLLVLGLLIYVGIKFNAKANPTPSKVTHNVKIEVVWTLVPVLILAAIAVPSFRLLYFMDRTQEAEMTLKVIGYQWYWGYEYPDHKEIAFDSWMVADEDLGEGQPRLLEVDNRVVLPTDTNIRVLITAADVIHSWAIPSLGLKTDAIPGRINETWVRIDEPGLYYGQCSELCGVNHGFMPVAIEAVSREEFNGWVDTAAEDFGNPEGYAVVFSAEPATEVMPGFSPVEVSALPDSESSGVTVTSAADSAPGPGADTPVSR